MAQAQARPHTLGAESALGTVCVEMCRVCG